MADTPFDAWLRGENEQVCRDLRKTSASNRRRGLAQQSYENCGLECCRQIINRTFRRQGKQPVGEQLLLAYALRRGLTTGPAVIHGLAPGDFAQLGRTTAADIRELLEEFGISSSLCGLPENNEAAARERHFNFIIVPALAARKGVVARVFAARLWSAETAARTGYTPGAAEGRHAVLPVAVAGGAVLLNDTGEVNSCGRVFPGAHFMNALDPAGDVLVTDDPIWV